LSTPHAEELRKGGAQEEEIMTMGDVLAATPNAGPVTVAGPLEAQHLGSRLYRNVADPSRITATHWHIAWANGLGWGFDGMDGAILALVAPMLMREFTIDLGTYRSGLQLSALISIIGLYFFGRGWPTGLAVATSSPST
jgi:hypothetical protein